MNNLPPNHIYIDLKKYIFRPISEILLKELPIWKRVTILIIIILLSLCTYMFGVYSTVNGDSGKNLNNIDQKIDLKNDFDHAQNTEVNIISDKSDISEREVLPDRDAHKVFALSLGEWVTHGFYKSEGGYLCPADIKNKYYFIWYKQDVGLVGNYFIKFQQKSISDVDVVGINETVLKINNKKTEYSEFYLPTRNRESVQYKSYSNRNDTLKYQKGGEITYPIEYNEPIELYYEHKVAEGNRIEPDYKVTYLSAQKGIRISDPLSFQPFAVNDIDPNDLQVRIGIGVNRESCIKIIKYCFSENC